MKNLGSMVYEVKLSNGYSFKCHQNQLQSRETSNNPSSDIISLPDDLLNSTSCSKSSKPTTPRYPRRNRKPPDSYVPM